MMATGAHLKPGAIGVRRGAGIILLVVGLVLGAGLPVRAERVDLRLRLQPGQWARHEVVSDAVIPVAGPSAAVTVRTATSYLIHWQIIEFDPSDDSWLVRGRFQRARVRVWDPNGNMIRDFDSTRRDEPTDIGEVLALSVVGGAIDLWVYEDGGLLVEESTALRRQVVERVIASGKTSSPQDALATADMWLEVRIVSILRNCFPVLPVKEVDTGDTWAPDPILHDGHEVFFDNKLVERRQGFARIESSTRFKSRMGRGESLSVADQSFHVGDHETTAEIIVRESDGWLIRRTDGTTLHDFSIRTPDISPDISAGAGTRIRVTVRTPD